ncbi:type III pantothenate kinase [Marixanthomonas spongiae]|uniref:Type III pantothenate kinase n=1 Tax=Marixanthomonas spongiae TaxID=2174845 RepID=A0A2U0I891_9FLAO|nr:type III pantothenate kinase [Marixanthomonas spongiae]PVW17323.1 type III pantothenate kinase [Marixanthomonas spongiae]
MNLIVDVGNTLIKLAVFKAGELLLKKTAIKGDFPEILSETHSKYPQIENCIVSSVGKISEAQLDRLKKKYSLLVLDHNIAIPFNNRYATPKTLGVDRIALISAAAKEYPNKNVLVVDVGTCVTYDFISEENNYLGGAISPGLQMRYKAMHEFTEKLPFLESEQAEHYIGNSTIRAMHSGAVNGMVYEIDGFITDYASDFKNLTVILTGGDALFLRDRLKNDIFANSNFLLQGLNHILEHNKH